MNKDELEFLQESNAIEGEYSDEAQEDQMRRLEPRIAGACRTCDVYVGGKKCMNPKRIANELWKWCKYVPNNEEDVKELHVRFEKIHPFEDGNGRTGRILMNWQRLKLGMPILIIHEGKEQIDYYKWFNT